MDIWCVGADDVGMKTDRHSRIVLAAIAAFVVVLVLVAAVIAVQPPQELDPRTPEGTAQAYFRAVLDGDEDLAFGYLDGDLGASCNRREFGYVIADSARVVIGEVAVYGSEARVEVVITETWGGGPFGGGSDMLDETLAMTRRDGVWLIARVPWPIDIVCP